MAERQKLAGDVGMITRKITWDIETWQVLECEQEQYSGPLALCKGADTANSQRQQELQMQQSAFDTQKQQLALLTKSFSPYLAGKTGLDPQLLATMRSQFLNSNNNTFNQAGQQVREALGARGEGTGTAPVGGSYATGIAQLMAAKAGSQSQGLLGVDAMNAQQALQNKFNAGNILSGNAAILTGTHDVAGKGASSALNDYIRAANTGFASSFTNAFGGALGAGLGAGLTGGIGTGLSRLGSSSPQITYGKIPGISNSNYTS
jgi:hypothetical protein